MITVDQLFAHFIGDYLLQSHWMATEKTKRSIAAFVHACCYMIPFVIFFQRASLLALFVMASTHFVIDRWRLARYVVWLKNWIGPFWQTEVVVIVDGHQIRGAVIAEKALDGLKQKLRINDSWKACSATGFTKQTPDFLAVWLLIIVDNLMHVTINGIALRYL